MSNLRVQVENEEPLQINEDIHLHIESVEVFTGDDDYKETDRLIIDVKKDENGPQLEVARKVYMRPQSSGKRLRFEPGVRINISSEHGEEYALIFSHHKGSILVDVLNR